jgi:hypothetical protein
VAWGAALVRKVIFVALDVHQAGLLQILIS